MVLLHGLGPTNASMLPVLAHLSATTACSRPTPPAAVRPRPRPGPTASTSSLCSFLDAVDARGAVVIGGFLGGRLALELALHDPEAVPAAESLIIPRCGHVPQLELPALTMALIRNFLHSGRHHARPRTY